MGDNMEEEYIDDKQNSIMDIQLQREQASQVQQQKLMEQQDASLASEQLDIEVELERLSNLLQGKSVKRNENGEIYWAEPKDNTNVILSEAGINLVMDVARFYVNKNTLLSNYDDVTIFSKMEDMSVSLADALFMSYEKYFLYPTPEEVEALLIERLEKKKKDIIATHNLRREKYDGDAIWKKLVDEIDPSAERQKIREQQIKNKLKGYDLLLRKVQDFIHSAYQRAWKGQERTTLRQHHFIQESRNPSVQRPQQGKGILGFFKGAN